MRISLERALELIEEKIFPLRARHLPFGSALGCVTAEDVPALLNQPPFPRSPYDGYALFSRDSAGASKNAPVTLRVVGRSFAGAPAGLELKSGEAVRIMTGGEIPAGADCVIMQEKTDCGEERVQIYESLSPYQNYCHMGEDFKIGEVLISAGTLVNAPVLAVAACSGYKELPVIPLPRTAIIATGDELIHAGEELSTGQIYSSNSVLLSGRLAELSVPVTHESIVSDTLTDICGRIESAAKDAELIITTGGVSVGEKDLVPAALEKLGAKMLFHGVAIKPGMPTALADFRGVSVLALSGNPFACAASFELLGRPLLSRLSANPRLSPPIYEACLEQDFDYHRSMRRFHRGMCRDGIVRIPPEQGNGQLRTMIGCNCLIELPSGEGALKAGSTVRVYSLESESYPG